MSVEGKIHIVHVYMYMYKRCLIHFAIYYVLYYLLFTLQIYTYTNNGINILHFIVIALHFSSNMIINMNM